eukprot:GHVT01082705.1.p1 GENE.GHVT01082705.1~~GHVT01082705.1.p1  ORF type:complete len:507 (-),score=66.25 GHVT01082705.1:3858-5378(-)
MLGSSNNMWLSALADVCLPRLLVSPSRVCFPDCFLGGFSASQTLTLTNGSPMPVTFLFGSRPQQPQAEEEAECESAEQESVAIFTKPSGGTLLPQKSIHVFARVFGRCPTILSKCQSAPQQLSDAVPSTQAKLGRASPTSLAASNTNASLVELTPGGNTELHTMIPMPPPVQGAATSPCAASAGEGVASTPMAQTLASSATAKLLCFVDGLVRPVSVSVELPFGCRKYELRCWLISNGQLRQALDHKSETEATAAPSGSVEGKTTQSKAFLNTLDLLRLIQRAAASPPDREALEAAGFTPRPLLTDTSHTTEPANRSPSTNSGGWDGVVGDIDMGQFDLQTVGLATIILTNTSTVVSYFQFDMLTDAMVEKTKSAELRKTVEKLMANVTAPVAFSSEAGQMYASEKALSDWRSSMLAAFTGGLKSQQQGSFAVHCLPSQGSVSPGSTVSIAVTASAGKNFYRDPTDRRFERAYDSVAMKTNSLPLITLPKTPTPCHTAKKTCIQCS